MESGRAEIGLFPPRAESSSHLRIEEGQRLWRFTMELVDRLLASRIIGFGEQTFQRGGIFALYIFEASEEPSKTDRLWEERG